MVRLNELTVGALIKGGSLPTTVEVVNVKWFGEAAIELTYKNPDTGAVANQLLYSDDEQSLEVIREGLPWTFDGDGHLFRLVSEAHRIRLAHLFDPLLAIHTSLVDPLPHQITGVYESMLDQHPLRFLLADDPGAGKTIMAGLLIKELIARGDLRRCLIVCPGSLVEQWQDEMYRRFDLSFDIMTNDKVEGTRTGNWLAETPLVIGRLDKLSRDEAVQEKLMASECQWDLVICDEAHKMSATFLGGDISYTKRYRLGQLLSKQTRHFLLMTATPHNGKEEDFQLFLALLDGDKFEGRFRDGVHSIDTSDHMRRMVKEKLFKFDGKPLFPERLAYTVPYKLSDQEAFLYQSVTNYVRQEFNRAEALQNGGRANTVGFALTLLQRRLASSPEAIHRSLVRRKERLETRLSELELLRIGHESTALLVEELPVLDDEAIDDLDDATDNDMEDVEREVLDRATAAQTINELKAEIETLNDLQLLAQTVRHSGEDRKWRELADLLNQVFRTSSGEDDISNSADGPSFSLSTSISSPHQKLVIFTEHKDTLNYLHERITTLMGRMDSTVIIHGGIGREERLKAQESFRHDPRVQVLLATDAAGEGINLQRAHLMVNYDLPWNPNRLEQRFGRIHRIGQTEVCHLWNLVAAETREGDVYQTLLIKLDEARQALGGQVFDVLGKIQFEGKPLSKLLIEAVRYGEQPEIQARLSRIIDGAFDRQHVQDLLEDRNLVPDSMDVSKVFRIREDMERAEARKLQPFYVRQFFMEAFSLLGGMLREREPDRYQITRVPAVIRNRDRVSGVGDPVLSRYERVAFEKQLLSLPGQPEAAFLCPGHPLLEAAIDLTLERYRELLRRGTVLVDENDHSTEPRVLFCLEHNIQDGNIVQSGEHRTISKRVLYVEVDHQGMALKKEYAPYLDYRPLRDDDPPIEIIRARDECSWVSSTIEEQVLAYTISNIVPEHLEEVRSRRLELSVRTEAAVKERLTKEIAYWDHRAAALHEQELAGKRNARLNAGEARKRADELQTRLQQRLGEIVQERQIAALPPLTLGGVLVVPVGLLRLMQGSSPLVAQDTQASAARAREIIMEIERSLGFEPVDRETDKVGYDIESRVPGTGKLRLIEVKGRVTGAATITVTKNEILTALNKPDSYILAIVEFLDETRHYVYYLREPFQSEPDFGATSVNYTMSELKQRAEEPS